MAIISQNVPSFHHIESLVVKTEEPIQHNYIQLTNTRLKAECEFHAKNERDLTCRVYVGEMLTSV